MPTNADFAKSKAIVRVNPKAAPLPAAKTPDRAPGIVNEVESPPTIVAQHAAEPPVRTERRQAGAAR